MSHDELTSVRRAIASLANKKHRRRYPAALRARLIALVRAHTERSMPSLARALDMAPQTLERITAGARAPLVPVRVVAEPRANSALVVRGPRGIVVEGLDVVGVAELIRALS
jgi:transposase-like protein